MKTSNHNIKFTYSKYFHSINGHPTWAVLADGKHIGLVKKAPCGWNMWRGEDVYTETAYRQGPRKYAAEHLAYLSGLLDHNYNTI